MNVLPPESVFEALAPVVLNDTEAEHQIEDSFLKEYDGYLGPYEAVVFDPTCGEPIGWGCRLTKYMGPDLFNNLRSYGSLECPTQGKWVLVLEWLSERHAVVKYGEVTSIELGPRGGFRSVAYGTTTFSHKRMRPLKLLHAKRVDVYEEKQLRVARLEEITCEWRKTTRPVIPHELSQQLASEGYWVSGPDLIKKDLHRVAENHVSEVTKVVRDYMLDLCFAGDRHYDYIADGDLGTGHLSDIRRNALQPKGFYPSDTLIREVLVSLGYGRRRWRR